MSLHNNTLKKNQTHNYLLNSKIKPPPRLMMRAIHIIQRKAIENVSVVTK